MGLLRTIFLRSNSGRRDAAVHFVSSLTKATAATPTFGDYTSPPPGFRELPAEPPEKTWSYTPAKPGNPHAFSLALANHNHIAYRGCNCV